MAIPKREIVMEKARELFFEQNFRSGLDTSINPEENELVESGFYQQALSELMMSLERRNGLEKSENFEKIEEPQDLKFNVEESLSTGFFICGTSQSGKTNLAKLLVQKLIDSGVVVYILDPSQAWMHDSPIQNCVTVISKKVEWLGSTVFDISMLDTRAKISFVNSMCSAIYERHVNGYNVREFIIFEEAQCYLPNGSLRLAIRKKSPCESVLDIVTVGANYGIRFGLVTQFPAAVDKAPVKISMQRYFGWTWEKNDVAYLKGFLPKEMLAKLISLERGDFIYQYRNNFSVIKTEAFTSKPKISKNNFQWNFSALTEQVCIAKPFYL